MEKYRKKPVVIEAYRTDVELDIETLEGTMHANVGDYIITGVNGEKYPCKPDIFEKTYEPESEGKRMQYPETFAELVSECIAISNRYDLYTLGKPSDDPHYPDGTEYLAGEYRYGLGMIPAQWVLHVLESYTDL